MNGHFSVVAGHMVWEVDLVRNLNDWEVEENVFLLHHLSLCLV